MLLDLGKKHLCTSNSSSVKVLRGPGQSSIWGNLVADPWIHVVVELWWSTIVREVCRLLAFYNLQSAHLLMSKEVQQTHQGSHIPLQGGHLIHPSP